MTSYQIAAHVDREIHPSYLPGAASSANGTTSAPPTTSSADLAATTTPAAAAADESPAEAEYDARCVFCRIVRKEQNAYPVWEDEHTLAFLGASACPSTQRRPRSSHLASAWQLACGVGCLLVELWRPATNSPVRP